MRYQTYVTMKSGDRVEYGFTFFEGDNEDSVFDLVLGDGDAGQPDEELTSQIEGSFETMKWAAEAVVKAHNLNRPK